MQPLIIYWIRRDFRLTDNPALHQAISNAKECGGLVLPVFVLEDYMANPVSAQEFGAPQQALLTHLLPTFLKQLGSSLIIQGKAASVIHQLSSHYNAKVYVNDDVHPKFYAQVNKLMKCGVSLHIISDSLSVEKDLVSGSGKFYSVFTPFKNRIWADWIKTPVFPKSNNLQELTIIPANILDSLPQALSDNFVNPATIATVFSPPTTLYLGDARLKINPSKIVASVPQLWKSETEVHNHLKKLLESGIIDRYGDNRDSLELDTQELGQTSKLSMPLAWGLISARYVRHAIQQYYGDVIENPYTITVPSGVLTFLSELVWREFYRYTLYHQPKLLDVEFQEKMRGIQWENDQIAFDRMQSWINGTTGYAIVDAAMNQLNNTGWMHNRARMIVASVLTKHLGIDWRWGQDYFRAMLIDLDDVSNNGGWQWGASTGTDPKPMRIFNPYLQADRYDPNKLYQKKWLPQDYDYISPPLIEHATARKQALERYRLSSQGFIRDY